VSAYLDAAKRINGLWVDCLGNLDIYLSGCPSDEQVAAVIEEHLPPPMSSLVIDAL
jgi:hypothetical protein